MKKKKETNPYYLAIATAILSGLISIVGFHVSSEIQAKNAIIQSQYEFKIIAYNTFLSSIASHQSPILAEILNIGNLVKHAATDSEIQTLENEFQELIKFNQEYQMFWQLSNDFGPLRLHGSQKIKSICDDILAILALREHTVNWNEYPEEIRGSVRACKQSQSGMAYIEERVTSDERIAMNIVSLMYGHLLNELRLERQKADVVAN